MDKDSFEGSDTSVLENFLARLEELDKRAEGLADRLAVALDALRSSGTAVCGSLLKDLSSYGSTLATIYADLEGAASEVGVKESTADGGISVTWLRRRAEEVMQAAERSRSLGARRDRSASALDRLAALTSTDPTAELLVTRLRTETLRLARLLEETAATDLEPVLEQVAPYHALDRLVRESQNLSTGELVELANQAGGAIAFEVVLAVTSGRIVSAGDTATPEATDLLSRAAGESRNQIPVQTPEESGLPRSEEETTIPPQTDEDELAGVRGPKRLTSPTVPPNRPTEGSNETKAPPEATPQENHPDSLLNAGSQASEEAVEGQSEDRQESSASTSTDGGDGTAATTVQGPGTYQAEPGAGEKHDRAGLALSKFLEAVRQEGPAQRPSALNDVVWCLIRDDRLGPAFHLARNLELSGQTSEAPSELIEALVLGPALRASGTEVATRIRDALHLLAARFAKPGMDTLPHDTTTPVLALIAFAAGLRPALLAQGTGAPELLARLEFGSELTLQR
jgi:hypothetical protein